jgi:C-terminal processing protease CtpA/Prc
MLCSQVKIGDILVSVDDVAVRGLPYAGLVDLVLGEEGTRATLVLRDDVLREVRVRPLS